MKKILVAPIIAVMLLPATEALAKRKHVRINKPAPACTTPGCDQWSKGNVPLVGVPPVAVAFDLVRRTSCDPAVAVSTGPADPGFDPNGPKTGNYLIPAIYRSQCNPAPTPQRRRM